MMATMHNDLIIGDTSQISKYMSNDIKKISARNISSEIFEKHWNRVYFFFAEQRTVFAKNRDYKELFKKVNVDLTLDIARKISCKKLVYLSTIELWNKCSGQIDLSTPQNFEENYYTITKFEATKQISLMDNSIVLYPFNFNSKHRSEDFLFGKIFQSVLTKKKISVGNLNWNRDILHANWVANIASNSQSSGMIGSGTYCNVKTYVKDIYKMFNLKYEDYVSEDVSVDPKQSLIYLKSNSIHYSYEQLLIDTDKDLREEVQ